MMFRTFLLLQALLVAAAKTKQIPPGLQANFAPGLQDVKIGEQNVPCTLYEQVVEFEDGKHKSDWACEVFGIDAMNAGSSSMYATVWIEGMEHVLKAKPDIESGRTTLLARGARFSKDNVFDHAPGRSKHKLIISSENDFSFGETNPNDSRRRKLSAKAGDLSVLVVRVSTPDSTLTKNIAEISGDVFGTAGSGDTINLKSSVEGCSNYVATINPGSGTGSSCVDDPDAIFDVPRDDPGLIYNCDFFNNYRFTTPGDLCPAYGDSPQIDDPNETANTRCCICGGGDPVTYDNNVVNGVMNLQLTINAGSNDKNQLETAAVAQLENLFYANNLADTFDNVMLCLPRGSYASGDTSQTNWVAYAYIGGYLSVYNGDQWCANEVTQLHELGHNFGLLHSSEGSVEYGDLTGAMGSTSGAADDTAYGNRMCFNGAHSWQLGWYTPYNLEINPLTTNLAATLVGVDRVPSLSPGQEPYLVLKLSNSQQDYYIMYNHAVGVNDGSTEARNQVTITTKTTASDAKTFLVSKLSQGSHVTFTNWAGTTDSVTVLATSIDTAASTGNAVVEVWKGAIGDRPQPPTPGPTSAPTPSPPPTPGPTTGPPTPGPTLAPTPSPPPTPGPTTGPPTPGPTLAPTSSPPPTPGPTTGPPTPAPTSSPPPTPGPTTMPPTPAPTPAPTAACWVGGVSCSSGDQCCSGTCTKGKNKVCEAVSEPAPAPAPEPSPPSPTPPSPTGGTCSTTSCSTGADCCSGSCNTKRNKCRNRRLRASPPFMN